VLIGGVGGVTSARMTRSALDHGNTGGTFGPGTRRVGELILPVVSHDARLADLTQLIGDNGSQTGGTLGIRQGGYF